MPPKKPRGEFHRSCRRCGWASTFLYKDMADSFKRRHRCATWLARQELLAYREDGARRRAIAYDTAGPIRECEHKFANHQHGEYAAFVLDKCRCIPCKRAHQAYNQNRNKQIVYGRWTTHVDAAPAVAHIQALAEEGLSYAQVAKALGVYPGKIASLLYSRGKGRPAIRRIPPEFLEQILAVNHANTELADGHFVPSGYAVSQIRQLVALGYSITMLGEMFGMSPGNAHTMLRRTQIMRRTEQRIGALYEELRDKPRQAVGQREKISRSRALRYAAERGWQPPGRRTESAYGSLEDAIARVRVSAAN